MNDLSTALGLGLFQLLGYQGGAVFPKDSPLDTIFTIIVGIAMLVIAIGGVVIILGMICLVILVPLASYLNDPKGLVEDAVSLIKRVRDKVSGWFLIACAIAITWVIHTALGLGPFHLVEKVYGSGYEGEDYTFLTYTLDMVIVIGVMIAINYLYALYAWVFGKGRRGKTEKSAGNVSSDGGVG